MEGYVDLCQHARDNVMDGGSILVSQVAGQGRAPQTPPNRPPNSRLLPSFRRASFI